MVTAGLVVMVDSCWGARVATGKSSIVLPSTSPGWSKSRIVSHLSNARRGGRPPQRAICGDRVRYANFMARPSGNRALALMQICHPSPDACLEEAKRLRLWYPDKFCHPFSNRSAGQWGNLQIFPGTRRYSSDPQTHRRKGPAQELLPTPLPGTRNLYRFYHHAGLSSQKHAGHVNIDYEHECPLWGTGEIGK